MVWGKLHGTQKGGKEESEEFSEENILNDPKEKMWNSYKEIQVGWKPWEYRWDSSEVGRITIEDMTKTG